MRFLRQQLGMHGVYRQTKLLLVPSTVPEGGPRVVREAGLSGIPAVGSAKGVISEHLGDGGLIVDDYLHPQAWAEVLRPLAADPDRLEQLPGRLAECSAREVHRRVHRRALLPDLPTGSA